MELVDWLSAKQSAEGLSDGALAKLLKVSQSHISRVKSGEKQYGLKLVKRLIGLWPAECDTIRRLALPCHSDRKEEAA